MRLGTKLLVSFITVAFLVLITGGLSYYLSNEIKNNLISESRQTASQLQILTEMAVQLQNSLLYTRNYLTETNKQKGGDQSLTTAAQIRLAEEITHTSLDQFSSALKSIRHEKINNNLMNAGIKIRGFEEEILSLTDSLEQSFVFYSSLTRELFDLEREGSFGDEVFNVTIEPYFRNTLLPILLQLRNSYNQRVEFQLQELQAISDRTVGQIIFFTVLAFVIAMVLAYLIYLSIAIPVKKLTSAAEELGGGDLSKRITLHSKDELAELAVSFNKMAENLSKSMVSRSYVNNIIQSMGDMLIVSGPEGNIELVNSAVTEKLGYPEEELLSGTVWSLISENVREIIKECVEKSDSKSSLIETELVAKEGGKIPVILTFSLLNDEFDKGKHRVFVASDITIQKEAERKISNSLQEKNVMLAEIHHRVKNNLAVISGLLEMQIWNLTESESIRALQESQLRIHSIALVHEKLYQTDNFASVNVTEYVEELVEAIHASFLGAEKNISIDFQFNDVSMTINQAIPFSLLLNEGVVNVYKHAFKGRTSGAIFISLKKVGEDIVLKIDDDGIGFSDKAAAEEKDKASLGMKLINTLSQQLDGEYRLLHRTEGGTSLMITFPVESEQDV